MKHLHQLILALALLSGLSLTAQTEYKFNSKPNGFSLGSRSNTTTTIIHNVNAVTLENADHDGLKGQFITMSGIHIANEAGAPDLPSGSAFVAIPNGAKASIKMVNAKTKTIPNVDLIPAPEPQLDDDDSPAVYRKDMNIYGRNAFYPTTPYNISEVMTVRGVEMVQVGVMPFQYNPVTKDLVVYEDLELELSIEGGDGSYGDIRYRNPGWDQILTDMLLNRDVLPEVDYGERLRKHYENRTTGCELLIITPDNEDFVRLADSIRLFRIQQGIPTKVYTVTQCGGNNEQSIRTFIRNAYNGWDMPPAAVLILGDHSIDATKGVVSYSMNNHPGGEGHNPYISDHRYAVMGNNHMPDLILGRITGRNADELYHMIKKDLDYERTPPTNPNFYDKPITAMGFQLERWFQLCSEVVHGFWTHKLGKHPVRLNAIYQGTPGSLWSTNENTNTVVSYFGPNGCGYIPANMSHLTVWDATGDMINDAINNGAFIIQHRDHGSEELWGEPSYSIANINRLHNNDLTYVMSNNCLTGRFNYGGQNGCFAEAFHRHQQGALGLIAATQVSYSFVNDVYVWGAYDNMWPDFMPTYGTEHSTNFIRPAFGNAAGKYFLRQSSWTGDGVKEITYYLFHHHGDPYMNLYSEMPQELDVETSPVLVAGSNTFQIKADEGATICLSVNKQIIGFGYGTGALQEISITPQIPGTKVKLTITKQNYYRYEHILGTIPAEGPYLLFSSLQVNDEGGNQNHEADYNETFNVNVSFHNVGTEGIDNVTASLSCPNPNVQILQNETFVGSIGSNNILTVNNAFTIQLGEAFEDGEHIRLLLQMGNSEMSFTDSTVIVVNAPVLRYTGMTIAQLDGEPTDRLMRGESALLHFNIENQGHSKSLDLENSISIDYPFLDVEDGRLTVSGIEAGANAQATFRVNVHEEAPISNILDYSFFAQSGHHTMSDTSTVVLGYTTESFEDELLNPLIQWKLGSGSKLWYVTEDSTATDGHCLHSPAIGDGNLSNLQLIINVDSPDKVSFLHKTVMGDGDVLTLKINNVEMGSWSGASDWERSEFDLQTGVNQLKFIFHKDNQTYVTDEYVLLDDFLFPPFAELILHAGEDSTSCPHDPFVPNSYVFHQKDILWSTNGDGEFDDPTLERPTYSFGANDIDNGHVTLTMTATADLNDLQESSQITIDILEDITGIIPMTPEGETLVDLRLNNETNYQTLTDKTCEYIWSLEPEQAGSITANGKEASVAWDKDFRGQASVKVKMMDDCGESELSEALNIEVINSTQVAENQRHAITVYPNPADHQIHIDTDVLTSGPVVIRFINVLGKVAYATEKKVDGNHLHEVIDISGLNSGLYDIQIISDNRIYSTRFVIK